MLRHRLFYCIHSHSQILFLLHLRSPTTLPLDIVQHHGIPTMSHRDSTGGATDFSRRRCITLAASKIKCYRGHLCSGYDGGRSSI
jgi:hypothetical protein